MGGGMKVGNSDANHSGLGVAATTILWIVVGAAVWMFIKHRQQLFLGVGVFLPICLVMYFLAPGLIGLVLIVAFIWSAVQPD